MNIDIGEKCLNRKLSGNKTRKNLNLVKKYFSVVFLAFLLNLAHTIEGQKVTFSPIAQKVTQLQSICGMRWKAENVSFSMHTLSNL